MPDRDHSGLFELMRGISVDLHLRAGDFEAIFEALSIGIALAEDPLCQRIRVNHAFAAMLGIEKAANASLSAPADERPPFRMEKNGVELSAEELPMQQAAAHGIEVRGVELDVVHRDGRRITLYQHALPLYGANGAVTGAIGVALDMTERRRVEQEQRFLAEASRLLTSSLDYDATLRALSELSVPMLGGYCVVDVTREDGAFETVAFVVDDPGRRELAAGLRTYPPRLNVDSPATRAIRTGEPVVWNDDPAALIERSAQSATHRELLTRFGTGPFMVLPLRARGKTLGVMTVGAFTSRRYSDADLRLGTDVAARASLALDNALLYRQAQEANRLKEDFLATLSHELRTPLNSLLGWVQMLKGTKLDDEGRRRALDSIERSARAQAVLINDLLDVSRVVAGKLRLAEQPVDVAAVVLAAADAIRPAVRAREIHLSVTVGVVTGQVIGDPDRLQQVVWNLLSNAVKFTPQGGRVDVAVNGIPGAVQIIVRDSGAGIDPAFAPHMFERFRQGDSSTTRTQGGLGLGLAIVRHLVDLHGGTVTAESEGIGKGASFTVMLPTLAALPPAAAQDVAVASGRTRLDGIRVLAVDDDEDTRELVLLAVRGAGAEVMVVSSADSALEAAAAFQPTVLVTDIAMPGMDGYALVREVRERAGARAPIAIALSAYLGEGDQELGRTAGFAAHLAKPIDFDRLIALIAELVQQSRAGA